MWFQGCDFTPSGANYTTYCLPWRAAILRQQKNLQNLQTEPGQLILGGTYLQPIIATGEDQQVKSVQNGTCLGVVFFASNNNK